MHAHKEVGETLMTDVDKIIAVGALPRIDVSNDSGCGHVLHAQEPWCWGVGSCSISGQVRVHG